MNPFESINPKIGLQKDVKSPFFGRYRLVFNQVTPFRELSFNRVFIKVNSNAIEEVKNRYDLLPKHLKHQIQCYNQGNIRNNEIIAIDCFEDDDWFLCLDMTGDVAFIPMYNFYFALKGLSNYLENSHFFIFSSGDMDNRWIDEYKILDGELELSRNEMEAESFWGSIIYYLKEAIRLNTNEFKRFAAFQFYDLLFDNKYCYRELGEDGKAYDEFGQEITYDIQEHIQTMNVQELNAINKSLKLLFNLKLDNNLKGELNKLFAFDLLDYKRRNKK
ncbi:hypothetical protein [Flagellimonas meishanensis]|uniref:hypothetical protein n=1 Tax=Flagellimonas meishanensis TaxID=2873264 RepID=UPI001CA67EEA|nr:hypothetical protein [[Muricauda] meishanensis]